MPDTFCNVDEPLVIEGEILSLYVWCVILFKLIFNFYRRQYLISQHSR